MRPIVRHVLLALLPLTATVLLGQPPVTPPGTLSGTTLELGYFSVFPTPGGGQHGYRIGAITPVGYAPKEVPAGIVDKQWALSLHATGYENRENDRSLRLDIGVHRRVIRPTGFLYAYGFEVGYARTSLPGVVCGVIGCERVDLTTNGIIFGPTARLGYDFSRRSGAPVRVWAGPHFSLEFFSDGRVAFSGYAHAAFAAGLAVELFDGRGRR